MNEVKTSRSMGSKIDKQAANRLKFLGFFFMVVGKN